MSDDQELFAALHLCVVLLFFSTVFFFVIWSSYFPVFQCVIYKLYVHFLIFINFLSFCGDKAKKYLCNQVTFSNSCGIILLFLKLNSPEDSNKRQKTIQDVLSEGTENSSFHLTFGHVVAICRARIPFIQLREEVHVDRRQPFVLI